MDRRASATCPSCELTAVVPVVFTGRDHLVGAPGLFAVLRCTGCGLAFTWPQLRPEEFGVFYPPSAYPAYRPARRRNRAIERGPYAPFFAHPPGRLLDVGCGVGHHGMAFRARGWVVHGIEPSESAAREAQRRGLIVHHGTLDDAELDGESFDLVIFNHSLEHIPRPRQALGRAYSLLKPGGDIAVAVPDFGCWQRRLFRKNWFHLDVPRHLQHFTSGTLAALAADIGFQDVGVTRYSSLNGLPNSVQYAVVNHLVIPQHGAGARLTSVAYRLLRMATWPLPGDHLLMAAVRPVRAEDEHGADYEEPRLARQRG